MSGGRRDMIPYLARAMIPAATSIGEFNGAFDKETGEMVGFVIWVPPGQELNSTHVFSFSF